MEEQKVEKVKEEEHDFRNIMLTIIGVFVVLAAVSGGTFAYFAFSASNNTTINGTAAKADLTLAVAKVSPSATGPLVPQNEAGLKNAMANSCVDKNSNKVCQVYSITITNKSTATATVGATVTFAYGTGSKFTNVRWKTVSANPTSNTAVTLGSTVNASATEVSNLVGTSTLAPNGNVVFYIVVWINETGTDQNSTDYGTFTGNVIVKDSSGKGLTSTFTS